MILNPRGPAVDAEKGAAALRTRESGRDDETTMGKRNSEFRPSNTESVIDPNTGDRRARTIPAHHPRVKALNEIAGYFELARDERLPLEQRREFLERAAELQYIYATRGQRGFSPLARRGLVRRPRTAARRRARRVARRVVRVDKDDGPPPGPLHHAVAETPAAGVTP